MTAENHAWDELAELLAPIHADVHLFARRIARSNAEGDDVFQEAVLRAARKLGGLRDRSRFKSWMYSIVASVHRTRCRRSFWKRLVSRDTRPIPSATTVRDGLMNVPLELQTLRAAKEAAEPVAAVQVPEVVEEQAPQMA